MAHQPKLGPIAWAFALMLGCQTFDDPTGGEEPISDNAGSIGSRRSNLIAANSLVMNSLGSNGIQLNGIQLNSIQLNSIQLNSIQLNAIQLNSIFLNSIQLNSIFLNSIQLNSIQLNAIQLNGIQLNGIQLNSIFLNGIQLNGIQLNSLPAADKSSVEKAIVYIAKCALSPSQTMTYVDLAGATQSVQGIDGKDPAWFSGPQTLSQSSQVAQCVQSRAVASGDAVVDVKTNLTNFKKVLTYMIQCALPDNRSATFYDEISQPVVVQGALGFAPEWETGSLTSAGKRKVSACLAARTNAYGQSVRLSLRSPAVTAPDDVERSAFNWNEGAFWGDLFSATPAIYTCSGQGNGVSGRLCTGNGTCGFTSVGSCTQNNLCSGQTADGAFQSCQGISEVVTTYLPIGTSASFGYAHTCLRESSGQIVCHGDNWGGQIGDGTSVNRNEAPTAPLLPTQNFVEIASTNYGSCARSDQGQVYCWGQSTLTPFQVTAAGNEVTSISGMGDYFGQGVCMLRANGTVGCQTLNSASNTWDSFVEHEELGSDIARIASSGNACAIRANGELLCWGRNNFSQLGRNEISGDGWYAEPAMSGVTDAAVSGEHTCARKLDGSLWCFGNNLNGQLGIGSTVQQSLPVNVRLTPSVAVALRGIALTEKSSCILTTKGTVWCWGFNNNYQVGDGTNVDRLLPVPVTGLPGRVKQLSTGLKGVCAHLMDDRLYCWGSNENSSLGLPASTWTQATPELSTLVDLRPTQCGNGTCSVGEDTANCPADCGSRIGDFACNGGETPALAPNDCGVAGDGLCTASEDCGTNPTDCGACAAWTERPLTNVASTGTAYRWRGNSSATSDNNKFAAPLLNDGFTSAQVNLNGSGQDVANAWEAAGVVWNTPLTINRIDVAHGTSSGGHGHFTANFKLQFLVQSGSTWVWQDNSYWLAYPYYPHNAAASDQTYVLWADGVNLKGVRVLGQVRTTSSNSRNANVREFRVY